MKSIALALILLVLGLIAAQALLWWGASALTAGWAMSSAAWIGLAFILAALAAFGFCAFWLWKKFSRLWQDPEDTQWPFKQDDRD